MPKRSSSTSFITPHVTLGDIALTLITHQQKIEKMPLCLLLHQHHPYFLVFGHGQGHKDTWVSHHHPIIGIKGDPGESDNDHSTRPCLTLGPKSSSLLLLPSHHHWCARAAQAHGREVKDKGDAIPLLWLIIVFTTIL
jgi:hypothetical protein